MKNIIAITLFIMGIINAQGITNTLGGDTADDKFVVENSDANAGLVVTGEGRIGIGLTNPSAGLHLKGDKYPNSFIRLESDDSEDAGFRLYEGSTVKWHLFNDAGKSQFTIRNNAYQPTFVIDQTDGNVGIGTATPEATLDASGDIILGENGTIFMEIREISGITGTGAGETYYYNLLPEGWIGDNTRLLSLEIKHNYSGRWMAQGYTYADADGITLLFKHNREVWIRYPDIDNFKNAPWRAIIMKMP